MISIISNARNLIAQGNHNDCLQQLLNLINSTIKEINTEEIKEVQKGLIILSNRFKSLYKKEIEGILEKKFVLIQHNQNVKDLIDLIERLEMIFTKLEEERNFTEKLLIEEKDNSEIEIVINRDFGTYSKVDQLKLLNAISELLKMDESKIQITKKKPGSVKLTLNLRSDKAIELKKLVKSGALSKFDVTNKVTNLSPRGQEDYYLVIEAIKGNQKAYATLMDRYRNSIFHMMLKMVKNREDADDLTLEAFGKAFNKLPFYVPRYAFSTWLFKIAINNCIDHIRKKELDSNLSEEINDEHLNEVESDSFSPLQELLNSQRTSLFKTIINHVSSNYQNLIELRYYDGLTIKEIASNLNVSTSKINKDLKKARESILEIINEFVEKEGREALDLDSISEKEIQKSLFDIFDDKRE